MGKWSPIKSLDNQDDAAQKLIAFLVKRRLEAMIEEDLHMLQGKLDGLLRAVGPEASR